MSTPLLTRGGSRDHGPSGAASLHGIGSTPRNGCPVAIAARSRRVPLRGSGVGVCRGHGCDVVTLTLVAVLVILGLVDVFLGGGKR